MFVAYPGVSLKVLRMFQCRTVDGVSYLEADMRLRVRLHRELSFPCLGNLKCAVQRKLLEATLGMLSFAAAWAVLLTGVGWLRHLWPGCWRGVCGWASSRYVCLSVSLICGGAISTDAVIPLPPSPQPCFCCCSTAARSCSGRWATHTWPQRR